jgi:PAS domain S-box-containing protein
MRDPENGSIGPKARELSELELLARAGETLSSSLDLAETLRRASRFLAETVADYCILYLQDEVDLRRAGCAHRDPERQADLDAFCAEPFDAIADGSVGRAIRERRSLLFEQIGPDDLALYEDPERCRLLQRLGPRSCVLLPIFRQDRAVGAITLARTEDRSYQESDLPFLEVVARRIGLALENAILFDRAHRAEELLHQITRGVRQILYVYVPSPSRLVFVNPAFEAVWGLRMEDLHRDVGSIYEHVLPEDRPIIDAAVAKQACGEATEVEYRIRRANGSVRWLSDRAYPETDSEGNVVRVVGTAEDITHRKRHERELEYLAAGGEILSSSLDYRITLANVAKLAVPMIADWCAVDVLEEGRLERLALAHVDPEKVRWGYELHRKYPPDLEAPQGLAKVLRTGEPELHPEIPPELIEQAARSEEHLELIKQANIRSAMLVPLQGREGILGVLTFVSGEAGRYGEESLLLAQALARRAGQAVENARLYESVERLVEERTAELREANQELEAFSYSVSHDLRAPLRAIVATSAMLQEDYGVNLPEPALELLHRQAESARRLGILIDELLQLSRLARMPLERQWFDLSSMAEDVARELRSDGRCHDHRIQVQPGMRAFGDPRLLRVVLQNMLDNACKFSPRDSEVALGSQVLDGDEVFFVRDRGIGFDMKYADKLFKPFERLVLDRDYPGTGIGLASVARIVRRHGGRIWAESEPGEGSTFFFVLDGGHDAEA